MTVPKSEPKKVRRIHIPEECTYCAKFKKGEMFPPHDPSDFCESNSGPHCTCAWCF